MMFQFIAITILIAFYGCYFVKMMSQKKKGIQTDQIGKGKVGFVKFVEVTMKIVAILVFAAGLASVCIGTSDDVVVYGDIIDVFQLDFVCVNRFCHLDVSLADRLC